MNALVRQNMKALSQQLQRAGPHLLLELLLPGGTLFALLLFLYRNRPLGIPTHHAARTPSVVAQPLARPVNTLKGHFA